MTELGLLYARQRWYDVSTGRWLSEDPIGFSGGLNSYAYVGQNPIGKVDPMGESPLMPVATFSHWVVPTNDGYDLAIVGSTADWYFPATRFNVTLEAPFSVMSSAGELATRWKTLGTETLDLAPMSRGRGASARVEMPGYKLKSLADEGVCKVRLTFAGQNSILSAFFGPPKTFEADFNADGTLRNMELLDLHLANQKGKARGPSKN